MERNSIEINLAKPIPQLLCFLTYYVKTEHVSCYIIFERPLLTNYSTVKCNDFVSFFSLFSFVFVKNQIASL